MERYLVFKYATYYPSGGADDFEASFDSFEEAEAYVKKLPFDYMFDRAQVAKLENGRLKAVKRYLYSKYNEAWE